MPIIVRFLSLFLVAGLMIVFRQRHRLWRPLSRRTRLDRPMRERQVWLPFGFWLRLRRDGRAENRFQRLDQLVLGVVVLVASPVVEIRSLKAPELERDTYLLQQDRHQDVAAQTLGRLGTNPV